MCISTVERHNIRIQYAHTLDSEAVGRVLAASVHAVYVVFFFFVVAQMAAHH